MNCMAILLINQEKMKEFQIWIMIVFLSFGYGNKKVRINTEDSDVINIEVNGSEKDTFGIELKDDFVAWRTAIKLLKKVK